MKKLVKGFAMISRKGIFIKDVSIRWTAFLPTRREAEELESLQPTPCRIVRARLIVELKEPKK